MDLIDFNIYINIQWRTNILIHSVGVFTFILFFQQSFDNLLGLKIFKYHSNYNFFPVVVKDFLVLHFNFTF